jgi:hypothetical protein
MEQTVKPILCSTLIDLEEPFGFIGSIIVEVLRKSLLKWFYYFQAQ